MTNTFDHHGQQITDEELDQLEYELEHSSALLGDEEYYLIQLPEWASPRWELAWDDGSRPDLPVLGRFDDRDTAVKRAKEHAAEQTRLRFESLLEDEIGYIEEKSFS